MEYSDKFKIVADEVNLSYEELHAASVALLHMNVETAGYRNMIRDIGKEGFSKVETVGDIKRIILGFLVAN